MFETRGLIPRFVLDIGFCPPGDPSPISANVSSLYRKVRNRSPTSYAVEAELEARHPID